jgi:hypothetical protein
MPGVQRPPWRCAADVLADVLLTRKRDAVPLILLLGARVVKAES